MRYQQKGENIYKLARTLMTLVMGSVNIFYLTSKTKYDNI